MDNAVHPKTPIPAATVILVRKYKGELQVYLLQRNKKSSVMAGKYVFPGGMVDAGDRDMETWVRRVDLSLDELRGHIGGNTFSVEDALAYGVAAIRETYEEAGARLWEFSENGTGVAKRMESSRLENTLDVDWFREGTRSGNWRLLFSRIFRWSHWISPKAMQRRFDTRFFLAVLPEGERCEPDNRETIQGVWINPAKALAANLAGEVPLSPPTLVTLHQLSIYQNLETLFEEASRRSWGIPIMPRLVSSKQGSVILEPWDPEHGEKNVNPDFDTLKESVLPVGEDFSRLWNDQGIWRPVGFG
jgi:8-oxo-dGTP pyrophosphatase MutT (NUDIX family)